MITDQDIRHQVRTATDASEGEYDIDAIAREIQDRYGLVDVDTIDSAEFWQIVGSHAITIADPAAPIVPTPNIPLMRKLKERILDINVASIDPTFTMEYVAVRRNGIEAYSAAALTLILGMDEPPRFSWVDIAPGVESATTVYVPEQDAEAEIWEEAGWLLGLTERQQLNLFKDPHYRTPPQINWLLDKFIRRAERLVAEHPADV